MSMRASPLWESLRHRPEIWIIPLVVFGCFFPALDLFFVLDDFDLLGPAVGARFQQNPWGVFTGMSYAHYSPVTGIWNGGLSALFGSHPAPYHAASLLLLSLAGILVASLLRSYGMKGFAPLGGATFFLLNPAMIEVPLWLTGANFYFWLVCFLCLSLLAWDRYLRTGTTLGLFLTLLFLLLASFTHSLAVIAPFALLFRGLLLPRKEKAISPKNLAWSLAGVFLLSALGLSVPRFLLGAFDQPLQVPSLIEPLLTLPLGLWRMFFGVIQHPHGADILAPGIFLLILLPALFIVRTRWRTVAFGLLITLTALVLVPALTGATASATVSRFRYMVLPGFGFSFLVGAALQHLQDSQIRGGILLRILLPCLLIGSLGAYFFRAASVYFPVFAQQDAFVEYCTNNYRESLLDFLKREPGAKIAIQDVRLIAGYPLDARRNNLHLQDTTFSAVHRFLFGHRPEITNRVFFAPLGRPMPLGVKYRFTIKDGRLVDFG